MFTVAQPRPRGFVSFTTKDTKDTKDKTAFALMVLAFVSIVSFVVKTTLNINQISSTSPS
jgi:hypothetical protein